MQTGEYPQAKAVKMRILSNIISIFQVPHQFLPGLVTFQCLQEVVLIYCPEFIIII